jgi:alpha/beta hydrolase fold
VSTATPHLADGVLDLTLHLTQWLSAPDLEGFFPVKENEMPFVTTDDDCEIYYESYGDGPTIAFAPGFMGITDIWRQQINEFSPRYRCVAVDNRGAGRSEKPLPRGAYGVERHAKDLHCVLSELGVHRVGWPIRWLRHRILAPQSA